MPYKKIASSQRTVLITSCSEGGMGAALAIAFHEAGLHVYATARDLSKMTQLASLGIETLVLDIQSDPSIASCVSKLSSRNLDILVNNAGASASMPISDLSLPRLRRYSMLMCGLNLLLHRRFCPYCSNPRE
jgi:NADP-dependent 3-hydroxy acid dehydrogenase YdfG